MPGSGFLGCVAPRAASALTAVAFTVVGIVASACSTDSANSTLLAESAPPAVQAGQSVIGKAPPATGGFPSVIVLEPQGPHRSPVPAEPQVMDQFGTAFHPPVLLVRAGQPVEFRNSEDLPHNVHVVETGTGSTMFNVDTPMYGSYKYTFERTGPYRVSCHIHAAMRAFILVTSTAHAVVAEKDGAFSLSGVPPGLYHLTVWNVDDARRMERVVEIEEPRTQLILEEIR